MFPLARIAACNVLRNRRRTLITILAIVVGVGVSLVVRGMLNGVQGGFVQTVVHGQVGALQVHRKGYLDNVLSTPLTLDFAADDALLAKVRGVPGVRAAARRIQFPGMVSVGDETVLIQATAIEPVAEQATCPKRSNQFGPGSVMNDDTILLGKDFAASVGALRGSEVVLLALGLSSAGAVGAALYPAMRASRLRPVEALRDA